MTGTRSRELLAAPRAAAGRAPATRRCLRNSERTGSGASLAMIRKRVAERQTGLDAAHDDVERVGEDVDEFLDAPRAQARQHEVRQAERRPSTPSSPASSGLPRLEIGERARATTATPPKISRNCRLSIGRPACSMRVCEIGAACACDFFSRSLRLSAICFFLAARSAARRRPCASGFCDRRRAARRRATSPPSEDERQPADGDDRQAPPREPR